MNKFNKPVAAFALVGTLALATGCTSNPHGSAGNMGDAGQGHPQGGGTMEMHDHMQKMNEMMQRMHQAQSPEEKQRMMQAHMQEMKKHMAMMQNDASGSGMGDMQQCMQMMQREQMQQSAAPDRNDPEAAEQPEEHSHDHSQE